jgi:flagellar biosynthetic protein FliQ
MDNFVIISKQALYLALILTGPPVLVAMLVGLVISLIQATTQIQEQTLTFVPKLVAITVTIAVTGPWIMGQLIQFSQQLFERFPELVK